MARAICQALDIDGKRCRGPAVSSNFYHGDRDSLQDQMPTWVRVNLCKQHERKEPK